MNWDNVIDRLEAAHLKPVEELYIEHYGKVLATERPEFQGRYFRCTYGALQLEGTKVEIFLFPSEFHRDEFLEVIGDNHWYVYTGNAVLHFPQGDPAVIANILQALTPATR